MEGEYNGGMKTKIKTSLTLSREVIRGIDRVAGRHRSRSSLVDAVLSGYLARRERAEMNARDLELLNRHADELNAEAEDVLGFQTLPEER
jgi:hypothetical protein